MTGDPQFDAAIAGSIFDMYGHAARAMDDEVTAAIVAAFDYRLDTLLAYKAVYALITSNAYCRTGVDGHFNWCIDLLNRSDIRRALGIPA